LGKLAYLGASCRTCFGISEKNETLKQVQGDWDLTKPS